MSEDSRRTSIYKTSPGIGRGIANRAALQRRAGHRETEKKKKRQQEGNQRTSGLPDRRRRKTRHRWPRGGNRWRLQGREPRQNRGEGFSSARPSPSPTIRRPIHESHRSPPPELRSRELKYRTPNRLLPSPLRDRLRMKPLWATQTDFPTYPPLFNKYTRCCSAAQSRPMKGEACIV